MYYYNSKYRSNDQITDDNSDPYRERPSFLAHEIFLYLCVSRIFHLSADDGPEKQRQRKTFVKNLLTTSSNCHHLDPTLDTAHPCIVDANYDAATVDDTT